MGMKTAILRLAGTTDQKSYMIGGLLCKLIIRRSGAPAGCDLTVRHDGVTLVTLTDSNAAVTTLYPSAEMTNSSGAGAGQRTFLPVNKLDVSLAQGDGDTAITVEAYYFE